MNDEIFADGIGEITVTGHIVRIDLVSLSQSKQDETGKPATTFRQRIVMPVDAFANAFELMRRAVDGLVEAGAIKRTAANASDFLGPKREIKTNGSPNFR